MLESCSFFKFLESVNYRYLYLFHIDEVFEKGHFFFFPRNDFNRAYLTVFNQSQHDCKRKPLILFVISPTYPSRAIAIRWYKPQ